MLSGWKEQCSTCPLCSEEGPPSHLFVHTLTLALQLQLCVTSLLEGHSEPDWLAGGWLYQEADSLKPEEIEFTPVSKTQPTEQQLEDLKFAWRIVKHVKSNAITVAKDGRLLGMGSGQPNRVKSTEIALEKAADEAKVSHHAVWISEGLAICLLLHHDFSVVHIDVSSLCTLTYLQPHASLLHLLIVSAPPVMISVAPP